MKPHKHSTGSHVALAAGKSLMQRGPLHHGVIKTTLTLELESQQKENKKLLWGIV